jgi:hypothetical protein
MKLKVICDGDPSTAKIVNAETNEELENVVGVEVSIDAFNVETAILIRDVAVDLNNLEGQEIRYSDSTGNDGRPSNTDN